MQSAIELFGNLVLTFIAFVVPIVGTLLSIFQEGSDVLVTQYENERKQTEKNIKAQLQKFGEKNASVKEEEIRDNLDKLKDIKNQAEKKLSYLKPKRQILELFIPLAIAFLGVQAASLLVGKEFFVGSLSFSWVYVPLALSLALFIFVLVHIWKLVDIIIELKRAESKSKEERETKQLLSSVLDELVKGESPFLKKVYIYVEDEEVAKGKPEIRISAQEKKNLKVEIANAESRMVKNIEIGLIFPLDFIIEKTSYFSVHNNGSAQIVRYTSDFVHGKTRQIAPKPLVVTPLTKGDHEVVTFIKAENVKTMYGKFVIKVE